MTDEQIAREAAIDMLFVERRQILAGTPNAPEVDDRPVYVYALNLNTGAPFADSAVEIKRYGSEAAATSSMNTLREAVEKRILKALRTKAQSAVSAEDLKALYDKAYEEGQKSERALVKQKLDQLNDDRCFPEEPEEAALFEQINNMFKDL